ncbi:zinc-dependent metalloprotease [Robertkochia aurantiaca]|uniref:zinc-dependent metalloprotease n=1 Tax=Robertkochia aurantiaca TaxID=2873700 RepID=UPI001CCA6E24|nr:zinc-dependent metalloprotease [Robertkochia sp. 3YJGBD-33]
MKSRLGISLLMAACFLGSSCSAEAQLFKKKDKKEGQAETKKEDKNGIKPFSKVIPADAQKDEGLFTVYTDNDKMYYEIPDSLFGREMLMVTRIAKTATNIGFGGGKANTQVLRWEKKPKKVLLRVVSHEIYAADSLPIHEAVVNSNLEPILHSFDIKALGKDSTSVVIQVNDLFENDVKPLGLPEYYRDRFKVTNVDRDRTYIENLRSYPLNIEARHVKTYNSKNPPSNESLGSITVEMNNSMVLLPKEPMKRRYFDQRVGWFARGQTDYGLDVQESKTIRYLDRWRLEVKEEDLEKFRNGELVEPKKPIVYYIDRATPVKWRKYIKEGIEDWQVAFEEAGFKNAIIAKDPPSEEEDPDWSPEDVRYSVVRYLASPIPNANGPHVSDPRSGEILESDINWYHNVMTLLKNWYFVQTAAINPDAQKVEFDDEIMGRLIRFVSSHEVGHTLGLPHNMGSSVAYPVDSLRSAEFTQKYGTAPSIMDYARFNYVAQPEDKGVALMPGIGVYDKYAIKWGYKPIPDKSAKEEKEILDSWILEHAGDPMYRFGSQQRVVVDPSSQTEDLGDDAVKASDYGIENLKRIVPNLIKWTYEKGENYEKLDQMYGQVFSQFNRYMGHVSNNIGGVYEYYKTYDQDGAVYTHVSKDHQQKCMDFLQRQLFATPTWMLENEIVNKIEHDGSVERMRRLQTRTLNNLLDFGRLARIIENEALYGDEAYSLEEMMSELRGGLFSELRRGETIDTYRRNLQRAYVERLGYLLQEEQEQSRRTASEIDASQSDIRAISRAELNTLRSLVSNAINRTNDTMSKYHLRDLRDRIDETLDPNS